MSGGEWVAGDVITAARANQKTVYVSASAPGTAYAGMLWYDTTNDLLKERDAANTAWKVIGPASQGTYASRPTAGHEGRLYHCTDTKDLWYDNGTTWDQWLESVALKDGDYAAAYVGISGTASGRAAYLDAGIASRATQASLDTVDGMHDVPLADAADDAIIRDVVGRKTDTAQAAIGTTSSLMRYIKGILSRVDVTLSTRSSHTPADVRQSVTAVGDPVDSIGRRIYDYLDAAISSRLAAASYVTERGTDNALLAANYVTERGTDSAALASVCTEARLSNLDAAVSSRLAAASYVTERGTDSAALASVLEDAMQKATTPAYNQDTDSLEAVREAIDARPAERGTDGALLAANYVTERGTDNAALASVCTEARLSNLDAAVSSRSGHSAADVWASATRKLTDYHIDSGATVADLAAAASVTPAAGYRFTIASPEIWERFKLQGYDTAWQNLSSVSAYAKPCFYVSYQKVTSGAGAQRIYNSADSSCKYGYFWENAGASPVQSFRPEPGEVLLEGGPGYYITVAEKYLTDHKAEIEADVENRLGYERHRDVLTKMGFKMP